MSITSENGRSRLNNARETTVSRIDQRKAFDTAVLGMQVYLHEKIQTYPRYYDVISLLAAYHRRDDTCSELYALAAIQQRRPFSYTEKEQYDWLSRIHEEARTNIRIINDTLPNETLQELSTLRTQLEIGAREFILKGRGFTTNRPPSDLTEESQYRRLVAVGTEIALQNAPMIYPIPIE